MTDDDWGAADAFDGGDYPVLGDVAAPSAPGKRAKRTFNKQQYTLDTMAAGTVTLDRPKDTTENHADHDHQVTALSGSPEDQFLSVAHGEAQQRSGVATGPDSKKRKKMKATSSDPTTSPSAATASASNTPPASEGKKRKKEKKGGAEELAGPRANRGWAQRAERPSAATTQEPPVAEGSFRGCSVTAAATDAPPTPAVMLKKQRNKFLPAFGRLIEVSAPAVDPKAEGDPAASKTQQKRLRREAKLLAAAALVESAPFPSQAATTPVTARPREIKQPGPAGATARVAAQPSLTRSQKKKLKWAEFKAQQVGTSLPAGLPQQGAQPRSGDKPAKLPGENALKKRLKREAKALAAVQLEGAKPPSTAAADTPSIAAAPQINGAAAVAQDGAATLKSSKKELPAAAATAARSMTAKAATEFRPEAVVTAEQPDKRQRVDKSQQQGTVWAGAGGAARPPSGGGRPANGGSQLLDKMRAQLHGGRFRWLNEQLYTSLGGESFNLMQAEPELYEQYHEGFRQQTVGWPRQPVDVAIDWLRAKPADWVVADFGCGDAKVADTVPQTVHSFDLVAGAPGVVACNMASVPLEAASVDVALFCLALMGTDYGSFLQEAARVMKKGGWLWIAEVRSRFAGTIDSAEGAKSHDSSTGGDEEKPKMGKGEWVNLAFMEAMKQLGFKLASRDVSNRMFVIMQFRKAGTAPASGITWPELKACVYKKR